MPEANLTVLGFDFGTHWIGVAVGQTLTATASPLPAVANVHNRPDWSRIEQFVAQWQPHRLIVGYPLKLDDHPTDMTKPAQRFSRQLHGRFHIPTDLVDERLTTREAWQALDEQGSHGKSKPEIDSIAAVLITESWLRQHARG